MNNTENVNMKVNSVKTVSRKNLQLLMIKDHQQYFKMSNADVDRLIKLLPYIDQYGILSLSKNKREELLQKLEWSEEELRTFLHRLKVCGVIKKPEGWVKEYQLHEAFIIPDISSMHKDKTYHRKYTEDFNSCDYKTIQLVIEHEVTYNIID